MDPIIAFFPPAVMMWFSFCIQDTEPLRFIIDCVMCTVITLWVIVLWCIGVGNSGMGVQMCVMRGTSATLSCDWQTHLKSQLNHVWNVISQFQIFQMNLLRFRALVCFELFQREWVTNEELKDGVNKWLDTIAMPFFLMRDCKSYCHDMSGWIWITTI